MWIATQNSWSKVPNTLQIQCDASFTNDDGVTPPSNHVPFTGGDVPSIQTQISQRVDQMNAIDQAVATAPTGVYTKPAPATPAAPTQSQLDLQVVQRAEAVVALTYYLKQLSWITGTETVVTDLKSKLLPLLAANVPKLYQ